MPSSPPPPSNTPKAKVIIGCLFILFAAFGFSAKSILVKLAYADDPHLDAISLMLLRMAISLPCYVAVALWSAKKATQASQPLHSKDWLALIVMGFLGYYLSSLLDFEGLSYISAGLERIILYLYPTFVIVLTAVIYRTAINRYQAVALLLSYAGVFLVYAQQNLQENPDNLMLGSALVASSAMTFAIFMIASDVMIKRMGALRFTAYSMTAACLITCLHFLASHGNTNLHFSPTIYGLATIMALFSTVLPSFCMNAGIQRIGAGSASIISSAGPIGTLVLAFFILGEQLNLPQIAGTLLVLTGVFVATKTKT